MSNAVDSLLVRFAQQKISNATTITRKSNSKMSKFGGFQSAASFAKANPTPFSQDLPPLSGSLQDLVDFVKSEHSASKPPGSGVIYVHKRKDTAFLAEMITTYTKVGAVPYHAGLKNEVRSAQYIYTSHPPLRNLITVLSPNNITLNSDSRSASS